MIATLRPNTERQHNPLGASETEGFFNKRLTVAQAEVCRQAACLSVLRGQETDFWFSLLVASPREHEAQEEANVEEDNVEEGSGAVDEQRVAGDFSDLRRKPRVHAEGIRDGDGRVGSRAASYEARQTQAAPLLTTSSGGFASGVVGAQSGGALARKKSGLEAETLSSPMRSSRKQTKN